MLIARTPAELEAARLTLRTAGRTLALVPTMGALHAGHLSLVTAAAADGSAVAVSIFVNPLQFDNASDLARYPDEAEADLRLLAQAGCALAWLPDIATMYPSGHATVVEVAGPAEGFEGAARPGHFRGVATVVARLFGQVRPQTAWFGEKDWQQLQVVRRMTADLLLPVAVQAGPTVREPDGLAMSSRNRFLSDDQRRRAPQLHATLRDAASAIASGTDVARVLADAATALDAAGLERDYLALVDGESLAVLDRNHVGARILAAARLGSVRLLDNVPVA